MDPIPEQLLQEAYDRAKKEFDENPDKLNRVILESIVEIAKEDGVELIP